jgi:hypothetical protein
VEQSGDVDCVSLQVGRDACGEGRKRAHTVPLVVVLDLAEEGIATAVERGTNSAGIMVMVEHSLRW